MLEFIAFQTAGQDYHNQKSFWFHAHQANQHHSYKRYSDVKQSLLDAHQRVQTLDQEQICTYNLALICLKTQKLREARAWIDYSLRITNPGNNAILYARLISVRARYNYKAGMLQQSYDDYSHALQEMDRLYRGKYHNSANYIGLGICYFHQGHSNPDYYFQAARYFYMGLYMSALFYGEHSSQHIEFLDEVTAHSNIMAPASENNPIAVARSRILQKNWRDNKPYLLRVKEAQYQRELFPKTIQSRQCEQIPVLDKAISRLYKSLRSKDQPAITDAGQNIRLGLQ